MMALLRTTISFVGVLALTFAFAKQPTDLDKAVKTTFKESRKLQKSYQEKLLTERREAHANRRKTVVSDIDVELGSDVPQIEDVPRSGSARDVSE